MKTETLDENSERVKLFYQYPTTVNSNNYGYEVGPSDQNSAVNGYYYWTSDYTVKTDSSIDSMYNPGYNKSYWLASPSNIHTGSLMIVYYDLGGLVATNAGNSGGHRLCPLVSLQSSAVLELQ